MRLSASRIHTASFALLASTIFWNRCCSLDGHAETERRISRARTAISAGNIMLNSSNVDFARNRSVECASVRAYVFMAPYTVMAYIIMAHI